MTRTFTEFAGFLAKRQHEGKALLVAIDGYGGSGKSTFTALLHGALRRAGVTTVTTVEADGFVMNLRGEDWRPIPSMPGERSPYRIDVDRLRWEVLEPLRSGWSAQFVHRDWWDAERAEVRIVHSQGIVLVEGTSTLDGHLRDFYDERIFLECPKELALECALARDIPPGEDEVGELAWREVGNALHQIQRRERCRGPIVPKLWRRPTCRLLPLRPRAHCGSTIIPDYRRP